MSTTALPAALISEVSDLAASLRLHAAQLDSAMASAHWRSPAAQACQRRVTYQCRALRRLANVLDDIATSARR